MATRTPTRRPTQISRRGSGEGKVRAIRNAKPDRPVITVNPEELSDFNESINWCIYGDSGVGKTVFASFAPNAHFLSTEKGVVSAKRVGSAAKVLRAPDWEHIEASLDWCDKHLGAEDWLIVDSVTKMQELLIRWWLRVQNAENEARDLDIPQLQDHQKWQRMFLRFIQRIIDAPYNSIFIATSMRKEDEEGDDIVLPNIVGKDYAMAQNLCADMDIVSCLRVRKRQNMDDPREGILINDTFPPYFAKDRFNVLPRWETIPDGQAEGEGYDLIADMIADILATSPEVRKAAKAADN